MIYNNLFDDFAALFPEDREWFKEKCEKEEAYAEDGIHIVFGMVVVPFLIENVDDDERLKTAFDYIEKMETSGDSDIAEVVEYTILESLIGINDNIKTKLFEYMGDETRAAYSDLKKWYKP